MVSMKTAVTVLQEMMVKQGLAPEYECISQSGPMHRSIFEYRCVALGVVVTAMERSKKEAKQEVARLMLQQLARRGYEVPAPFGLAGGAAEGTPPRLAPRPLPAAPSALPPAAPSAANNRTCVALLKELCEEYKLPAVDYELVGDVGPPHMRLFTVKAHMGMYNQLATATTKKAARQLAAEALYAFLRENLARVTQDFDEDEALARSRDRKMDRFVEVREEVSSRPDLAQKIADYHLAVISNTEPESVAAAAALLQASRAQSPERALAAVAAALGLALEVAAPGAGAGAGAGGEGVGLALVTLAPSAPELVFAGASPPEAAAAALRYLQRALAQPRPAPAVALAPAELLA